MIRGAAAWPIYQPNQAFDHIIGVSISQQQICQRCWQEAVRAMAQGQADFQQTGYDIGSAVVELWVIC